MTSKHVGEYFFGFFLVTNKESIQTTKHQALVLVPSKCGSLWELGCLHLEKKRESMARTEERQWKGRNKKQESERTASGPGWARKVLQVKTGRVKSGRGGNYNHFIPDPTYFT